MFGNLQRSDNPRAPEILIRSCTEQKDKLLRVMQIP